MEMQFKKICLDILRKVTIVSDDFNCHGVLIPDFVHGTRLSYVLGTKSCCVVDDLGCMRISERHRRLLAKEQ